MEIGAVREGIATALSTLGIHAYAYAPDAPIAPAAYVYPDPFTYHDTFAASEVTELRFVVRFLISSVVMEGGQNQLDLLLSVGVDGSAVDLLEADITLGGVATSTQVMSMRNYTTMTLADGIRYLSAELVVSVYVQIDHRHHRNPA